MNDHGHDEDGVAVAFLAAYLEDRRHGRVLSLREYQLRFPGFEALIEREHAALEADEPAAATGGEVGAAAERRIGPYVLLADLGKGGMGAVYLAEQQSPVRRRVALKLIKPGMGSADVLRRFDAERQALAMMEHPHIARVFDAGTSELGQPYFVMEHVPGVPLTQYCDRERLALVQRLELFGKVCNGVQHAHQKGIIHRDLKPSNVLVTLVDGVAVPKIIDFGLAKAVRGADEGRSQLTVLGDILGTIEYMSPEQADLTGRDVDTRSDVYALGVILYELLTGSLPFSSQELRSRGYTEMERILRDVVPPRPSTRLSPGASAEQAGAGRRTSTSRRAVSGDLDRITMKALEKDRERRYQSAAELAADIRRHLDHEPVVATEPTTVYRVGRFVRRHRALVAGTAAVFVALVAGLVVALVQKQRADDKATSARASFQMAFGAVNDLLTQVGHEALEEVPRMDPVRRELLQKALSFLERCLASPEADDREVRQEVAKAYSRLAQIHWQLGHAEEAERDGSQAVERFATLAREASQDTGILENLVASRGRLARYVGMRGDSAQALALFQDSLGPSDELIRRFPDDPGHRLQKAAVLGNIGSLRGLRRELAEGLAAVAAGIALMEQTAAAHREHPRSLSVLAELWDKRAELYCGLNRFAEAEVARRTALDFVTRAAATGPDQRTHRFHKARILNGLAAVLGVLKRFDEEEPLQRECIEILRALVRDFPDVPDYHGLLGGALSNVGDSLRVRGDLDDAIAFFADAIREERLALAAVPDHSTYRKYLRIQYDNLCKALAAQGRHAEVATRAEELLALPFAGAPEHLAAAAHLVACARLAQRDDSLAAGEPQRAGARYAGRAVEMLGTAVAKGASASRLLEDRRFSGLRNRADFQRLCAQPASGTESGTESAASRPNDGGPSSR